MKKDVIRRVCGHNNQDKTNQTNTQKPRYNQLMLENISCEWSKMDALITNNNIVSTIPLKTKQKQYITQVTHTK